MATFQSFEEIEAWRKARELTRRVYTATNQGGFAKDFGLRDQIRRAIVSIMSNIAEGCERSGTGEFVQFLAIAKGSAGEVRAQLYVAFDQGYLKQHVFEELLRTAAQISRMLSGLMAYLRKSDLTGTKYKKF
ncbi:MAG TPA: four helix bundle protein [Pyrinomonadaceae bacterium]|nr:four helix bundle protein [Pyrinomonadaceae bacterium]